MGLIEITFIALGLSLDAFAVSLGAGAGNKIESRRGDFRLAFHFGLFQALMPIVGWFVGSRIEPLVKNFDHWIAFILLLYVGINMIKESYKNDEKKNDSDPSKGKNMIMLAVATSIDALVIGFSFAMLRIDIWYPSAIIGLITATMSIIGIYIGKFLGEKFGNAMERIGGLVIIGIGIKILFSHIL